MYVNKLQLALILVNFQFFPFFMCLLGNHQFLTMSISFEMTYQYWLNYMHPNNAFKIHFVTDQSIRKTL